MARPVTIFTGQWGDLPLAKLAPKIKSFGYDGLELACWGDHFDVFEAAKSKKYCDYNTCGTIGNYKLQKEQRYQKRKDTVCSVCGKVFTPKRADSKYCSNACRQKAYRERVTVTPSVQNEHEVQA